MVDELLGRPENWKLKYCWKRWHFEVKSLLQKGPKFAITPATILVKEYTSITTVWPLQADELNGIDWSALYHDVNWILNTYMNKPMHTKHHQSRTSRTWKSQERQGPQYCHCWQRYNPGCKDKAEYITKCETLPQDNSFYQHLSKDTSLTIHKKHQNSARLQE